MWPLGTIRKILLQFTVPVSARGITGSAIVGFIHEMGLSRSNL